MIQIPANYYQQAFINHAFYDYSLPYTYFLPFPVYPPVSNYQPIENQPISQNQQNYYQQTSGIQQNDHINKDSYVESESDLFQEEKLNEKRKTYGKTNKKGKQGSKQKFGRNISSNIFNLLIKFIKRARQLTPLIEKCIENHRMIINIKEFNQILKIKSLKLKSYANNKKINEFWTGPKMQGQEVCLKTLKQIQFTKLFRALGRHYLNNYHILYVFNSNKIKTESKTLHIEGMRKMLQK